MGKSKNSALLRAMVEECEEILTTAKAENRELPLPLHSGHLTWMCAQLNQNLEGWSSERISRWVGFIQCALIANGMIDLDQARKMFDQVKLSYGRRHRDVVDHLDLSDPFEFDVGGEG